MTYRTIHPQMWDDERFSSLSIEEKLVWIAILTGTQTTCLPGLAICGVAALAEASRLDIDTVSKAFDTLSRLGMIIFNQKSRVIRVPNAPKYNPCSNEKVLKGWFRCWKDIPECVEKYEHIASLREGLDTDRGWTTHAWAVTFGQVNVPSRYRIDTVSDTESNSVSGTGTQSEVPPGDAGGPVTMRAPAPSQAASRATPKRLRASAPRGRALPASQSEEGPASDAYAERIYNAIMATPALAESVANADDAAKRWADPSLFPGVDVPAEIRRAGERVSNGGKSIQDGRAYLQKCLENAANTRPSRQRSATSPTSLTAQAQIPSRSVVIPVVVPPPVPSPPTPFAMRLAAERTADRASGKEPT